MTVYRTFKGLPKVWGPKLKHADLQHGGLCYYFRERKRPDALAQAPGPLAELGDCSLYSISGPSGRPTTDPEYQSSTLYFK